jgi:hypothetical protein
MQHSELGCASIEETRYQLLMASDQATAAEGELVRRALTLRFDEFGWERLESEARQAGETLDDLLSRAAVYFCAERPTARAATLAPRFKPAGRGTPRQVRLEGDGDSWERLDAEARRQGLPLERLLEHAALLYLADIDSGRLATRILDQADEGDRPRSNWRDRAKPRTGGGGSG